MATEKIGRMYSPLKLAGNYLYYYLTAGNGKGHGIHSPFVFDFVTNVLNDHRAFPEYAPVETLRKRLRRDTTLLKIEDMGAGSISGAKAGRGEAFAGETVSTRSIREITRYSAKPPRLGQLLFRVARHYHPSTILELGTSLGLSTAYLAAGAPGAQLYTIEGASTLAAAAGENLRSLGMEARIVTGNFDDELRPLLGRIEPVDLAFIDGNHRYEPTLHYFEAIFRHSSSSAVLIFDDIHWSTEMERAWAEIRRIIARIYDDRPVFCRFCVHKRRIQRRNKTLRFGFE